jgi:hypothetical protein
MTAGPDSCRLSNEWAWLTAALRGNKIDLETDELGRDVGAALVASLAKTNLDHDRAVLDRHRERRGAAPSVGGRLVNFMRGEARTAGC